MSDLELLRRTLAPPFRIKVVEAVKIPSREERERILKEAHYSPFRIRSEDVYIDLLTDSGTAAMSDEQWAAMMRGDEAYVGSKNYYRFEEAVKEITGFEHVIPTHQGRAAENVLFGSLIKPGDIIPGNTHFDTTRAHIADKGGKPIDLIGEWLWDFDHEYPFRGNLDPARLEYVLRKYHDKIPFILLTGVNNVAASSPISMENIRETRELAERYDIPIFFDACRFFENCYLIKVREPGYGGKSVAEIVREALSYADGCYMSCKKDALVNIGGFIALRDEKLAERCKERLVLYEGFPTYGGLARRDLEAIAIGLREGLDERYLEWRVRQVAYLGELLERAGARVIKPTGGSGVFLDVYSVYPHLSKKELPEVAAFADMYLEGAVRIVGAPFPVDFVDLDRGEVERRTFEFVRFAIPRRALTKAHMEYVGAVMERVVERAHLNKGFRVVYWPEILGHFFARYEPIS